MVAKQRQPLSLNQPKKTSATRVHPVKAENPAMVTAAVAATVSAEVSVPPIALLIAAPSVPRAHLQRHENPVHRVKAVATNAKASAVASAHRANAAKLCPHKLKIRWPWTSRTTLWASVLLALKDVNRAKVVAMDAVNAVKVVEKEEERVVAAA